MKLRAFLIVSLLLAAGAARAGFRHPVEDSGTEAQAIARTVVRSDAAISSASRVMPDRAASRPAPSPVPAVPESPRAPKLAQPASKPAAPRGPVPKAPALPSADRFGIPGVHLPHSASGDGLLSMKPEPLSLKGMNRPQVHAFLKHARSLPMPKREYTTEVRSRPIAENYRAALHPTPYRGFRTDYSLSLSKIGKIQEPPSATQYENMVKRIDSLFLGLELRYPKAISTLWELAQSPTNARELQARDALFAGLLSNRAGWETTAALLLEESAEKRIDREARYLGILWNQLESVSSPVHLEKIVASVSPARVQKDAPAGDKANFALAKLLLLSRHRAPSLVPPASTDFAKRITSKNLRDKLQVLAAMGPLRGKSEAKRAAAVEQLKAIEAEGNEENRQQARLALARTYLQHGSPAQALELYRGVKKDGRNRLAVLSEQTYAEYVNGAYQDSLGKTVALQTPYFRFGFAPDVHLVEIMTRKAMCDFGGAEAGVARFHATYDRELTALEATLARNPEPAAYYEELIGFADAEQPFRHQRYLLQLPSVMENQKAMNQALAELARLDTLGLKQKVIERPQNWDAFMSSMRQRWTGRAGDLRQASARNALREATYLAQRLRHTYTQVELLDLDVSTGAAKNYNLQSALNFPAKKQEEAKVDSEKLRWPFESEIWEDEIDFMKAKNPSKCAVAASL